MLLVLFAQLYTIGELLQIKSFKGGKNFSIPVLLPAIKIPKEARSQEPLLYRPKSRDLTSWFSSALKKLDRSSEANFMKKHKATKEQWALFYEVFKSRGAWDLKQYISPNIPENKDAFQSYLFEGIETDYDVFGNFIFGFMAQRVGYPKTTVLAGAGYVQIADRFQSKKKVDLHGIDEIKDFRDDHRDQLAIIAGYELAKECGSECTTAQIKNYFQEIKN